jgi:hypothetical protein
LASNPSNMHKTMPKLKNITCDEELVRWMGQKALHWSITNFTRLVDVCIWMLELDNHKKYNLRIEIICLMTVSYGILFMPPLVVVDIFVCISMQWTNVRVLELGGCKLGVVTTTSGFLECMVKHLKEIGLLGFTRTIWRWCWIPKMHLLERQIMISIDPSLGSTCGRQDGNNVIV